MVQRYQPADGWVMQAFQFALDPTDGQAETIRRQFGGRRKAYNWAVETFKADLNAYHASGAESEKPSASGMQKRWNQVKRDLCVDEETGEEWWPLVSKDAFAYGIRDAVDGYWNWQTSRAGKRAGRRVGFPRFKKKGKDADRFTAWVDDRVPSALVDRRHVKIPKVGKVRLHENARRLHRLIELGRAKVRSMTVRRVGNRLLVTLSVDVSRHDRNSKPRLPASVVGVDVGVRYLAVISDVDGNHEIVPNPKALEKRLSEMKRLCRAKSRRTPGSRQYRQVNAEISDLYARVAAVRRHHLHVLTTTLAKTHGRIVVEDLDVAAMVRQKNLPGARSRRRGIGDAGMAGVRRQLRYKTQWYGSELVEADRWFPSSKTCSACGHVQAIGWAEHWTCDQCGADHHRDINAAINLARYTPGSVGPVGSAVKRGADRQTGPRPAGGEDTRKLADANNPETGHQLALALW